MDSEVGLIPRDEDGPLSVWRQDWFIDASLKQVTEDLANSKMLADPVMQFIVRVVFSLFPVPGVGSAVAHMVLNPLTKRRIVNLEKANAILKEHIAEIKQTASAHWQTKEILGDVAEHLSKASDDTELRFVAEVLLGLLRLESFTDFDRAEFIASKLLGLKKAHLMVFKYVAVAQISFSDDERGKTHATPMKKIVEATKLGSDIVPTVAQDLTGRGLFRERGGFDSYENPGPAIILTEFGETAFKFLRRMYFQGT